jgi:hypothetical protein
MNTLKEIAQRIRDLKPIADVDLFGVPYHERTVAEGTKRSAQRELVDLTKKLEVMVADSLNGFFVFGPPEEAAKFAAIAEDGGGAFTVSARELYLKLADAVLSTTPGRMELGHNQIATLLQAVQVEAVRCGAVGLPYMALGKLVGARFDSRDQAGDFIYQHAVYPLLGDELNVLYLRKKLTDEIAKISFEQSVVPVIVLNATKQEAEGGLAKALFPSGNLVVDTEGSVDKDQVIRAFKQLKEMKEQGRRGTVVTEEAPLVQEETTNKRPEKAKKRKY